MDPIKKLNSRHKTKRFVRSLIGHKPKIVAKKIEIGKNVYFGKNVEIRATNVKIGDGCIIKDNVRINGDSFEMGDYGFIYHDCYFPGGDVKIGHNFWLGNGCIVDGRAGTTIGNNVGIGAQSQLWTHMMFGDVMEGCRFFSENNLVIGDDVWLTGHNLVSPVKIGDRSMDMLGSLITKDMEANKTYAGSPAKDMTDKLGSQFEENTIDQKKKILSEMLNAFADKYKITNISDYVRIIDSSADDFNDSGKIQFNIVNRKYAKTASVLEYYLMRFLLPKIKFLPQD